METEFAPVAGIFDTQESAVFTRYAVGIQFTQLVIGGIPQNPEIIESWLRQRILGGDQELAIMLRRTLADLEIEVPEEAGIDEMIQAAKKMASERNANTFRRSAELGLCLGAYQVKAMLKESTAILYPYHYAGEESSENGSENGSSNGHEESEAKPKKRTLKNAWGPTKKAARSLLAERVHVDDYLIPLGRAEPDGTLMHVGHVSTPRGPRSTLSYHDYCVQPELHFTVSSSEDIITKDQWARILIQGQRLGLGAMRSMGHGSFKVTALDRLG